ncbi:MAG: SAM-dependent methyltransferase [Tannerellaceae bacterium]|jgi:16S rRNA (cytidine1402-2'-O)-methyltransferase|nr:SAM-dependent methyltransferase [Tannerellaceae bacterium]
MKPTLYLIPSILGDTNIRKVIPPDNCAVIIELKHYIVENIRSARRFLRKVAPDISIDELSFYELNEHTPAADIASCIEPLARGEDMGVISEAGCPAVADPGAAAVEAAHRLGCRVVPLVGPSSILLALMASGFNGQSFAFNGYLPADADGRIAAIRKLETRMYADNQTQIFMETPYRNNKMAEDILRTCRPSTRLCIASDLTCSGEYVRTRTVAEWNGRLPDLHRKPTIYLIYK